jgi:hypothetical protein
MSPESLIRRLDEGEKDIEGDQQKRDVEFRKVNK